MRRRGEPVPHELDGRSTEELHEAASGFDEAGWEAQRQGFVELRDLSGGLAEDAQRALAQLRETWTGSGAESFAAEFGKVIELLTGLQASAGVNADGMAELGVVASRVRDRADELVQEDKDWQANPDGDDDHTVAAMREGVRNDLLSELKEADGSYQHLAASYLLPPPEPPRLGGMAAAASELGELSNDSPALQSAPQHAAPMEPAPAAAPPAEPAPAPAPAMPVGGMGGMAADTGGGATGGGRQGSGGPVFDPARNVTASRMRSDASRQQLHNQLGYGPGRDDAEDERRAVHAEDDDSPFAPTDATVVPPVISGGILDDRPHDSGPVLTGTVYRHFPEYGQEEARPDFTEEYEDGSSVEFTLDGFDDAPIPVEPEQSPEVETSEAADAAVNDRLMSTRVDFEDYWHVKETLSHEQAAEFAEAQQRLRQPEAVAFPEEHDSDTERTNRDGRRSRRRGRQERLRAKWDDDAS